MKNVLTLLLTNVKSTETNLPYGAIILNLDANDIQNYYRNITENEYDILAIDSKGRVVLNSDPKLFLENISDRHYIKNILSSTNSNGRFLSTINGKPSIVTYRTSDRLGLKFINIVPFETLTSSLDKMLKLLVYSSLTLFLTGIIIAFFSCKRIYSPIDKTIKTVRKYFESSHNTETEASMDETNESDMEYLSKIVNLIISRPIQLQKLQSSDLRFIKKQLLIGLLYNKSFEILSLRNKLIELDVKIGFENVIVIVFKIDSYNILKRDHSKDEFEKMECNINDKAIKIMDEFYKSELVVTDEDEFCMIISMEKGTDDVIINLAKAISDIQEYSYNSFLIPVSAAIGDLVHNMEDASISYKSAKEYIKYRFKYGQRSISFKNKVEYGISSSNNYDKNVEEAIFRELKAGNIDRVERELDKMYQSIMKFNYNDMMLAISRLLDSSQKVVHSICQMSGSSMEADIGNFSTDLSKFHAAGETKAFLLDLYKNTINHLKEKKRNRKNEIIDSVVSYINENYSYELLTPETIAENFNLSANYLRLLFKEVEGKSLSGYINEVRFKNAKSFLEQTNLTAAEISVKVGFSNYNYFYTAFKKFYGVSPSNYRNNLCL